MSFPTSLIGNEYPGTNKWQGGALASDGCIYAAPLFALRILKIDPNNRTTALVGPPISGFGAKYSEAVATDDGYVYFVPCQATQVLKFNIQTQAIQLIGEKYRGGPTTVKWQRGAMGNDGCFYCVPRQARQILKVDLSNDSTSLVGDDLGGDATHMKYSEAIASQDKAMIYFIPLDAKTILTYDVSTERCTHIRIDQLDYGREGAKWSGGVLAPDGCIYAMPSGANNILKYDPSRIVNGPTLDNYDSSSPENPTLVGDVLGSQPFKWVGAVLGRDGYIYGIPFSAHKVLRYHPQADTHTLIGTDFPGSRKWFGGVLDNNGNIVSIPCDHQRVLRIIPSLFSHNPRSMKTYQPSGMDDSPNNRADRLGYELYAEALVDHILSVERTGESISVGLFSPWGSGKSFFWNLSKKEFQRRDQQEQKEYQESTAEQDNGTEMGDEFTFISFILDMQRRVEEYRGKFWHWPLVILFWVTMGPLAVIFILYKYIRSGISILDYKLTTSPWGDKYKSLQGMVLMWQKNIASFCSLAFLGIPLLRNWVQKAIGFFFQIVLLLLQKRNVED